MTLLEYSTRQAKMPCLAGSQTFLLCRRCGLVLIGLSLTLVVLVRSLAGDPNILFFAIVRGERMS